jgi:TPR repeat protein
MDCHWETEALANPPINDTEVQARKGDITSQFLLAHHFYFDPPKDSKRAFYWYCKAGIGGHPTAEFMVAAMYNEGDGVPENQSLGEWWLKQSASRKFPIAENELGVLAEHREAVVYRGSYSGPPADYATAARWYALAAEQDYAEAERNLGVLYVSGKGVPKDYGKALEWLKKAALQNDATAQFYLGDLYKRGRGSAPDAVEAFAWYCLAAQSNLEIRSLFVSDLKQLTELMTPEEIQRGQKRAAEIRTQISRLKDAAGN